MEAHAIINTIWVAIWCSSHAESYLKSEYKNKWETFKKEYGMSICCSGVVSFGIENLLRTETLESRVCNATPLLIDWSCQLFQIRKDTILGPNIFNGFAPDRPCVLLPMILVMYLQNCVSRFAAKKYDTKVEDGKRFANFAKNLKLITYHNKLAEQG